VVDRAILRRLKPALAAAWLIGLSSSVAAQDAAASRTFLGGGELAARVLNNVVIITVENAASGSGFVIGARNDELFIVTALHVLTGESDTAVATGEPQSFSVRFCADPDANEHGVGHGALALIDRPNDIAVFRLPAPEGYSPNLALLATRKPLGTNRIWSVGKDGDCVIADVAAVEQAEDAARNIIISHGGRGGTSGAPAMSGEGIVGLVWSTSDGVNVIARSIEHVREIVAAANGLPWSLTASNNVPPLTREAAAWDLTAALNNYVFNLKNVRDALVKKVVRGPEFEGVVDRYNEAMTSFNAVKDRHDGTLAQHWGIAALQNYSGLRSRVESAHAVVYSFNEWMQKVRDSNEVPNAIRKRMRKLSPEVEKLDVSIKQFLLLIKQP
jgi:hypothetical protein